MLSTLIELYDRDLARLREEILAYNDESLLWTSVPGISNPGGNLCLHLCGNLNHFIGMAIGGTGYVRDRESEFARRNVPVSELVAQTDAVRAVVKDSLGKLSDEDLSKDFPLEKHGEIVSNGHMLLHLFGHLSYHLGQINYHRRMQ